MSKAEILRRLEEMTDEQFALVAPYLEADLEAAEELDELNAEVEAARTSARKEPLLETKDVLARARQRLLRGQ